LFSNLSPLPPQCTEQSSTNDQKSKEGNGTKVGGCDSQTICKLGSRERERERERERYLMTCFHQAAVAVAAAAALTTDIVSSEHLSIIFLPS
jgi:hypothetical protein